MSNKFEIFDPSRKLIRCLICERKCVLAPGMKGFCGNYINRNGVLDNVGFGLLSAVEPRPIEIKPLFHYYPNSIALTFSTWGCNFKCPWCQNYFLSWKEPSPKYSLSIKPLDLVKKALRLKCHGICGSFNETSIQIDYLVETSLHAKENGLYSVLVTNGYFTIYSLRRLLDAGFTGYSIDIKGCPKTYRKYLGADPYIVLRNAKYIINHGGHVEMIYLIVTKANDWDDCINWVIDNHINFLGYDVPLHINRYFPMWKYDEKPTPMKTLFKAYKTAKNAGINYVYIGNIIDESYQDTICPKCGKRLIIRRNYRVIKWGLTHDNKCPRCGYKIEIYGSYTG